MYTQKYYEMIIKSKDLVETYMRYQDPDAKLSAELTKALRTQVYVNSINWRAAIATVIVCGGFENYDFLMPTTRRCVENFRRIRRDLSKGRTLSVDVWKSYFQTSTYTNHTRLSF